MFLQLDITEWLVQNKPVLSQRLELSQTVVKALASCGKSHSKDIRLVFEVCDEIGADNYGP